MSWALDSKPIRSVLLTRLRYLGDIVMSTVLVEVLRQGDPELEIGYLCEDGFADVLAGHPGIDRLHVLGAVRKGADARARVGATQPGESARGTPAMIRDLRSARYDLAVDLFFNPRSAWLLRLAGIPRRIGGTRKWRGRLYTHRVVRSDFPAGSDVFGRLAPGGLGEHLCRLAPLTHVESGLDFASWLPTRFTPGALRPRLARPALAGAAAASLAGLGIGPERPFVLLAPCATWRSKEWPASCWEEMVSLLVDGQGLPVVVLPAPGREQAWQVLGARIPAGRGGVLPPLPLPQALAVTAAAASLLTVDGGIMHAGVGLGIPTLALFGPTDPDIWFPYEAAGPYRVMATAPYCHPCNLHECPAFICLPQLDPESVWREWNLLLDASAPGEGGGDE